MRVEKRTMNWLPRPSAYDEARAQQEKRKAVNQDFISRQSAMADAFSAIRTDQAVGVGEIASRAAAGRLGINLTA